MKKLLLMALAMTCLWTTTHAQVGINTTNPTPGTILDIHADNKGILIPRVDIDNPSTGTQIDGDTTNGLLVYNTNTSTGEGFYYWYNTQWIPMGSEFSWRLTGNSGVDPDNNFIGTVTNDPLAFRTYNEERMRILDNGRIGVNSNDPEAMFHVVGTLYGADGGPAIFTEIANDISTWAALEANNPNTTGGAGILSTGAIGVRGQGYYAVEGLGTAEGVYGQGFDGVVGVTTNISLGWAGFFDGDIRSRVSYAESYVTTSDQRVKKNFRNIEEALSIIKTLNPLIYEKNVNIMRNSRENSKVTTLSSINVDRKNDNKLSEEKTEFGLIAQELELILPELVTTKMTNVEGLGEIDLKSVNYIGLIPILTKAIQEQQEIIENQEARIAKLEVLVQQLLDK